MRRKKDLSVVVRSPSRGLVTRLPGESADLIPPTGGLVPVSIFLPSTMRRAASAAQNVRYEDGVVCAAPGYEKVRLVATILQGLVAQWNLDETIGTRLDASGNGRNLSEAPGFDALLNTVLDVTAEPGKNNNAAVFPALRFIAHANDSLSLDASLNSGYLSPFPNRVYDWMVSDTSLPDGQCFISPRAQNLLDAFSVDDSLGSGVYFQTISVGTSAPQDGVFQDGSLDSGSYVSTVVASNAPQDGVFQDGSLDSGSYVMTVIPANAPQDGVFQDGSLDSGSYIETIVGPQSLADGLSLTSSMDSGSYG